MQVAVSNVVAHDPSAKVNYPSPSASRRAQGTARINGYIPAGSLIVMYVVLVNSTFMDDCRREIRDGPRAGPIELPLDRHKRVFTCKVPEQHEQRGMCDLRTLMICEL